MNTKDSTPVSVSSDTPENTKPRRGIGGLSSEQVMALAAQLAALAAIFRPDVAGSLRGLVAIGAQLNTMIQAIRTDDPEMWAKVSADYKTAAAGFEASVAASRLPPSP